MRLRGLINLQNAHTTRNHEHIALRNDLTDRAQDLQYSATELTYLANLLRTKVLVAKNHQIDNSDIMESETLPIINDLITLAEDQESTVLDIDKQLEDLEKACMQNYQELLNPNQKITYATSSIVFGFILSCISAQILNR